MLCEQFHYISDKWNTKLPMANEAQLVFAFGSRYLMQDKGFTKQLHNAFPHADIIGCSTSGEILDCSVFDNSLAVTAFTFCDTHTLCSSVNVNEFGTFNEAIDSLVTRITPHGLKHIIAIADGQVVNGSDLVEELSIRFPNVSITGGLAGDDSRFEETITWLNDEVGSGIIAICGFYGDAIQIGHGSFGGWDTFGPDRLITKSKDNVLYELDDQSALSLYKQYLGDYATELPISALRFPLSLRLNDGESSVVRTILSINEEEQSMTFAGDMPEGIYARLMTASPDRLVDGAEEAAKLASLANVKPEASLLISCVGRRLFLEQETEMELEGVKSMLSDEAKLFGFYSYGEISPVFANGKSRLHNQTMTITTFAEKTKDA